MLLTGIEIDSFRTITTAQKLDVDPKITILMGANESGKTNLLQAIQSMRPKSDLSFADISKCKRDRYMQRILPEISFTFSISEADKEILSTIDSELVKIDTFVLHKKGNGLKGYSITIPENNIIRKLCEGEKNLKQAIEKRVIDASKLENNLSLNIRELTRLQSKIWQKQNNEDVTDLQNEYNVLNKEIKKIENEKHSIRSDIAILRDDLRRVELEKAKNPVITLNEYKTSKLLDQLPEILYFKDITLMPESISIKEIIQQETPEAKSMANFLKIGNIDDLNILNDERRRLRAILRDVSRVISDKFSKAWLQEPLKIEINKEGDDLSIELSDAVSISSSPSERSEGFQWFLSFIACFYSESHNKDKRKIILLDEPALRLHPKGQKDLLKVIERLSNNDQFIYTTHSPFLVNRNFPQRIRLLEKNSQKGTIINNKPYSNGKTRLWEPLKSSIGICLGDLFSLGETNLIVEGVSDEIIIAGISNKFAAIGESFLDLNEVTIVPATGADCVDYLAGFALSEGLNAISLFDNDAEGKKCLAKAQKEVGRNSLSVDSLKKGTITIEDLIPEDVYIRAVNSFYKKFEKYKEYKNSENKGIGIIERLSRHFKDIDMNFDKVSVSRELVQQLDTDELTLTQYEPFKNLFEMVSKVNQMQE